MARDPESETGLGPRLKLSNMSIPELISELRDSFLSRDFDRVEEVLVARDARLTKELEEKKREIGSLRERIDFERLEKINAELELKRLREKEKGCGEKLVKSDNNNNNNNNNGFGLGGGIVVKSEKKCMVEEGVVEVVEGGKIGVLREKERGVDGLENEKGKKVVGINNSVSLNRNGGGIGASGGELGLKPVIVIVDSDDECNSQATLNKKETTSCINIIDDEHRSSSSGAPQKNLLTGLAERIGNLKRKFVSSRELDANINALDDFDSDSSCSGSSSSSSSGPYDKDLPTNHKKLRADATSPVLKF
ncbi:hypothetical protein AAZX31_18G077400 [Glycine max]|uniref:Uncharacterized protein n=1 Tax=Glycine soja TaxID=3848 RepID=A0A0B2PM89_GLYSO|nr:uncharacterized protein LOC114395682 isoform X2 [Glycine soja]KAG4920730.1 hypothetical protein JHK86_049543 [Glycine max]KAG4923803.1 hypothetical protein JHK87_049343 [Glycine soja]KAG5090898.1 hypothetical protein JHK82_049676 [Glycine max]KHN08733.1 hypothetical protein glysoja_049492 [Glycine soja]